ncbi:MAG: glycosyltransferase family 39 protein [Alphaproteobacteria bacterium]
MTGRTVLVVFLVALGVRLAYLWAVYDGTPSLLQPDSPTYLMLARDFIDTGGFNTVTGLGIEPETERMPLYVLWLAAFRAGVGPDALWPVLGQAVIDALTCVLITLIARRIDPRLALPAGLLAAFNLTMIAAAGVVLTDTLFLALLAGWMLATVECLERPSTGCAVFAGLLLGLATLTRAMMQFFPPLLALVLLAGALRRGQRLGPSLGLAALGLGVCLAVMAPLAARNLASFGHLALTSQGGTHALHWVMPAALEFAEHRPFEDGQELMRGRLEAVSPVHSANPFVESARAMAVARAAAAQLGVVRLAKAWLAGATVNLAAPSVFAVPPIQRLERPSFYATPGDGLMAKLANYVTSTRSSLVLALLAGSVAATLAVRLVQLVGLFARRRELAGAAWLFLLLVAAYVVVVTGPVTGVKYRLPLEPLLTILTAAGLVRLWPAGRRGVSAGRPATTPPTARS